jgi:peptidoglycan/xylan/chitin deacetylase (PgdA/CDA1 family)
MYHDVVDDAGNVGFRHSAAASYQVDMGAFQAHLAAVAQGPLCPVTVLECADGLLPACLLLTFDDGGSSALAAAEMLEERGWRGHFFITTGLIGSAGFLTKKDIGRLHVRGHVIGSHSHTHPNICYDLSRPEMLAEWQRSCELLAEITGRPVLAASVPGGDMDRQTIATAAEAGIRFLFTSEPTFRPWQESGATCFGRVCVKRGTSLASVQRLLRFRGFGGQMAVRRCKQLVKRLMAPVYRRSMPRSYGLSRGP